MSLLWAVLSWTSLCRVLVVLAAGLGALVSVWTARLLARHAWFTYRLSCFSKPHANSWLLGHLGQMQSSEEGLLQVDDLVRMYTHSCSWFIGPFYHLVRLFHPDYVKPLLMAPASVTIKDELIYGHLRPWLGQSLLLSNGAEWSRKRRLLTPAFHFDTLKDYVVKFNTSTDTMHEKWRHLVAKGTATVEMFDHVTLMTLDSLLKCAFSYTSDCQKSTSEYVSAIVELSELVIDRRQKILHHWDWFYWKTEQGKRFRKALSTVHRFTREVVQKRRALISQQTKTDTDVSTAPRRKKDFVDIILLSKDEDGRGLTDEEIQAEANTFMFAGHDTTASAICWTLYNLARHEHYQEKCRQEAMDLMQGRDRHVVEWEDLSNLPFTTMCIRESLRLHAPVQAVTRKYNQDMALPGRRIVPKGAICLVSIYGTHHNPAVWTSPDVRNEGRHIVRLLFTCRFLSRLIYSLSGVLSPAFWPRVHSGTGFPRLHPLLLGPQELHWAEIRPGTASGRRGVDPAQVSPDPGGEPRTRGQVWGSAPSPSTRPACGGRFVAAA
ncbi:cytochrome P450 4F3 isoform X1 [Pseudoliparis swirei]|uniref:cytochrome P450 4F3 isoform X1 n=1 Tax=Pseudoliparis swirei TaxID=2059687 RepID=UPI0024BEAE9C|nr:cytochrome P450 4F3 isoform X1 [Pseudoliparis swirei]